MTALLIAAGLVSGIIAGMGVGGGSLLVPILAIFTSMSQQQIQGINLIIFIPASIAALIVHVRNKSVDLSLARPLMAYGIVAAAAGAFLALYLKAAILRKVFAFFIFFLGLYQLLKKGKKEQGS